MPVNIRTTPQFEELRRAEGYYVDKTGFFETYFYSTKSGRYHSPSKVSLLTRPRRFGKTLFMTMLASFFDITKDSRDLFAGLKVAANEELCGQWMNRYPVVFLTFRDVGGADFEDAIAGIHDRIRQCCSLHEYLLTSDRVNDADKRNIQRYLSDEIDEDRLGRSLHVLTRALACHHEKMPIVLIDEYDVPLINAYENSFYEKMFSFETHFLSIALKDNQYLNFSILTGRLRITTEYMYGQLNNIVYYDITSYRYSDVFGFTQTEVDKLLAEAGYEDRKESIRKWYDGYRIGDRQDIYCPWSIMKYLEDVQDRGAQAEPKAYWVSTGANELPGEYVRLLPAQADVRGKVAALLAGYAIEVRINPAVSWDDVLRDADNFWTLLYLTGYLTKASDSELYVGGVRNADSTLLAIPNREVRQVFQKEIESWLNDILSGDADTTRDDLYNALWDRNVPELEKALTRVLLGCGFHDDRESYYHGMVYGILRMSCRRTFSNGVSGLGRYDIIVQDPKEKRAAVLEFNRVTPGKRKREGTASQRAMSAGARNALEQIADMKYDSILRVPPYRTILHVGIAFCRNTVKVRVRKAPADD